MNEISDSKGVYAQSSDIQSRTYLQYRLDMKRKAIVELEIVDWFKNKLKEIHKTDNVTIEKSGGDAHIWFLRSGKISGKPDYTAYINGQRRCFEFQYATRNDLEFYDFKVSKVGKKSKGKRRPHDDREFLYIIMPSGQFSIFSPKWIMQNGIEAGVPAWGNRTAFRVPEDKFKEIFISDNKLSKEITSINKKIKSLGAQSDFIKNESRKISINLQNIVDQNKNFEIIPKTLDGFYKTCFLMDQIKKFPKNNLVWLVYGSSFFSTDLNSRELARLIYSLDFLYGGSDDLNKNTLTSFVDFMNKVTNHIVSIQEKNLRTCKNLSPKEESVNFLFVVNLYEDITQELRHLYNIDCFNPVKKIFQTVNDLDAVLQNL